MINGKTVTIVIPCRNESEGIFPLVQKALKVADEVVVVDNRSGDNTAKMAKLAGAKVIQDNRIDGQGIGYGYALKTGIKAASSDLIVTMDGDGTYPLDQVREAVRFMDREALDFVICSRFPLVDGQAISWWRQLGVWLLNTQVWLFYRYPMQDILSGMWLMNQRAKKSLKLSEGGWNLSPEIKLAAIKSPYLTVGQYHIRHYEREFGQSKQKLFQTGLTHLTFIIDRRIGDLNLRINGLPRIAGKLNLQLAKLFARE